MTHATTADLPVDRDHAAYTARLRLLSPFFAFRADPYHGAEGELHERPCTGLDTDDECDGATDARHPLCWRHDNAGAVAARLHRMVRRRALLVLSRVERYDLARFASEHGWYGAARVLIGGAS